MLFVGVFNLWVAWQVRGNLAAFTVVVGCALLAFAWAGGLW